MSLVSGLRQLNIRVESASPKSLPRVICNPSGAGTLRLKARKEQENKSAVTGRRTCFALKMEKLQDLIPVISRRRGFPCSQNAALSSGLQTVPAWCGLVFRLTAFPVQKRFGNRRRLPISPVKFPYFVGVNRSPVQPNSLLMGCERRSQTIKYYCLYFLINPGEIQNKISLLGAGSENEFPRQMLPCSFFSDLHRGSDFYRCLSICYQRRFSGKKKKGRKEKRKKGTQKLAIVTLRR